MTLRHQIIVLQRQIERPRFNETDRTILSILNTALDQQLIDECIEHYNTHRPHQGLHQRAPNDAEEVIPISPGRLIERQTTCAGLIKQYRTAA